MHHKVELQCKHEVLALRFYGMYTPTTYSSPQRSGGELYVDDTHDGPENDKIVERLTA